MKRWIAILTSIVLALPIFSGCADETGAGSISPGEQELPQNTAAEPAAAPELLLDGNSELVMAELNRFLESIGKGDSIERFDDGYHCNRFEDVTLYRTTRLNNWNLIVAYREAVGTYQWVDLGDYGLFRINSVRPLPHDPAILEFGMESKIFGGDHIFTNFPSTIYYSLEAERVIEAYFATESGSYGTFSGRDHHLFDQCRVSEDEAVFTFVWTEGGDGNGYDAPEILVESPNRYENENPTAIGFRFTSGLDDVALGQLRAMDGVQDVQAEQVENGLFTGTLLTLTPLPDYEVVCDFRRGEDFQMESFSVRCVQVSYDQPDFSNHLGYALELPGDVMMEHASVYYSRRAQIDLTIPNGDAIRLQVSASPVDSLSRYDYDDPEDFETVDAELAGRPVTLCFDGAGGWEAHWYEGEHHLSLWLRREDFTLEAWSELAAYLIGGCHLILNQ